MTAVVAPTAATADVQLVTGTIVPVFGVSVSPDGVGSTQQRDGLHVSIVERGPQTIITIVPAG